MTDEHQAVPPCEGAAPSHAIDRRQLLKGAAALALAHTAPAPAQSSATPTSEVHDLGVAAAAHAIRSGSMTSEFYAAKLLERARSHADLQAFITIDHDGVLQAARVADKARAAGKAGPLLGVPISVKDSYLTHGLVTTFGTSVFGGFKPAGDAAVVAAAKQAGAIVFGKNNLVEMSYGLTGLNAHHGQVRNPHNKNHVTGGSSSGGGASVAARIVPAALGGDTVGSIRVPAALCGVVGFKPTPGRWSSDGIAPISGTLDTAGILARNVEDCVLMDTIATQAAPSARAMADHLKGLRFAYAPRQYLADTDPAVEKLFQETLRKLKDAGATLVEIDLGPDFFALADRTTWPIFFHETMPEVRNFVKRNGLPVAFEQIYEGLGAQVKGRWTRFVVPNAPNAMSDQRYQTAMQIDRPELQRRFSTVAFAQADVLIFPTTPCAAPSIDSQWKFSVAGKEVADTFLARNTHPGSAAGLPGISLPMGMTPDRLPLGLEIDANVGRDADLLQLARRVERAIVNA